MLCATSAQVSRAHEIGEPLRQLALVRIRIGAKQHVGDDEAEHVVAEEFQPLVAAARSLGFFSAETCVSAVVSSAESAKT